MHQRQGLASAQSFVVISGFNDNKCTGNPIEVISLKTNTCYTHSQLCDAGKIDPEECKEAKLNPNNPDIQYSLQYSCEIPGRVSEKIYRGNTCRGTTIPVGNYSTTACTDRFKFSCAKAEVQTSFVPSAPVNETTPNKAGPIVNGNGTSAPTNGTNDAKSSGSELQTQASFSIIAISLLMGSLWVSF